ncbi:hypothetical protein IFM89_032441, partial [Coptis chinensis]
VRRYVYQDVVRLEDLKKFFDCRYVQVQYLMVYEGSILRYLYDNESLSQMTMVDTHVEKENNLDDCHMTPKSVLDGESSSCNINNGDIECTASSLCVRRKKRSRRVAEKKENDRNILVRVHKRKGIPIRSPLF